MHPNFGKHFFDLIQKKPFWIYLTAILSNKKHRAHCCSTVFCHLKVKLGVIALRETDIFGNPFYSFSSKMKFQGWWSPVCSGWLPDAEAVWVKIVVFRHLSAGVSFQFSALVSKLFLLKFLVCFQGSFLILKCSWGIVSLCQPPLPLDDYQDS